MISGRRFRNQLLSLGILFGVIACASPRRPPSPFEGLLSGLLDVRYKAVLVYARAGQGAVPLAVVLDPEGGARISILELSELEFMAEDLGEMDRADLVKRLDRMEGQEFGGRPFAYLKKYSKWRRRPVMRYGVAIGQVMTVDPRLRFEVRTGTSGRVHSILLRPASAFIEEVRGE